jgi:hypothetical protein
MSAAADITYSHGPKLGMDGCPSPALRVRTKSRIFSMLVENQRLLGWFCIRKEYERHELLHKVRSAGVRRIFIHDSRCYGNLDFLEQRPLLDGGKKKKKDR